MTWDMVALVQVLIWLIVFFEWKNLEGLKKADKITFATLLVFAALLSFFKLENVPGPITLFKNIFGYLGRFME